MSATADTRLVAGTSLREFLHGLPGVDQVGAEARAAMLADFGWRGVKIRSCSAMTRPRSTGARAGRSGAGPCCPPRAGLCCSLATMPSHATD